MPKPLNAFERRFIVENYSRLGPAETARRVGCSKQTAIRVWKKDGGGTTTVSNQVTSPEPQTKLDRLIELRGILRAAMNDAPPQAISSLAREYRETVEEIDRMEGGSSGDSVSNALDSIAARIAAKMPAP